MSDGAGGRQGRSGEHDRGRVSRVRGWFGSDERQFPVVKAVKLASAAGVGVASGAVSGAPLVGVARAAFTYVLFDAGEEGALSGARRRERAEERREGEHRGASVESERQGVVERVVDGIRGEDGEGELRNEVYAKLALAGGATAGTAAGVAAGTVALGPPLHTLTAAAVVGWAAGGVLDDARRAHKALTTRIGTGDRSDGRDPPDPDGRGADRDQGRTHHVGNRRPGDRDANARGDRRAAADDGPEDRRGTDDREPEPEPESAGGGQTESTGAGGLADGDDARRADEPERDEDASGGEGTGEDGRGANDGGWSR